MPVLLEKFPTLKFILIDPNYHSVNWKSEYIYQNIEFINRKNLGIFKHQMKNNNPRYKHLGDIARLGLKTKFIYDEKKDVVRMDIPVDTSQESVEVCTAFFEKKNSGFNLNIQWDNVKAVLPIYLNKKD